MKCPLDTDTDLVMTERSGVEIDYCPKCRGVWLDRGELDKLIERAAGPATAPAAVAPVPPAPAAPQPGIAPPPQRRLGSSPDSYDSYGHGKKRRGSLLKEIFDF